MQLKHLNLTTSDVSGLAAFFERFFGFKRLLERGSGAFTILSNNEDFVLTLMKAKRHDPVGYPETFHVGFYLDNPAAVQTKHDEFAAAGLSPGEIHCADHGGRGTHFYCTAPGNVIVEIATPERLPGGACTHWKTPPCHGAHPKQTLRMVVLRGKPTEFMIADDFRYAPSVVWAT